MHIVLFASTETINVNSRIDPETGEVQQLEFLPLDWAKAQGFKAIPMPRDLPLYRKANKTVFLNDLGHFVLGTLTGDGELMNEFRGREFTKPMSVSMSTLRALAELLTSKKAK